MKRVVIVLKLSTQKEERISIDEWRIIRQQEKRTKIKVYELLDIVDEATQTAPQFKARSLSMQNSSILRSTKTITPPKKKKCCGG